MDHPAEQEGSASGSEYASLVVPIEPSPDTDFGSFGPNSSRSIVKRASFCKDERIPMETVTCYPARHLDAQPKATLTWRDLTVKVVDDKGREQRLLKSVSGFVEPSEMLAIMGPGGSGKTTLLDTLAGRSRGVSVSGEVRINGHPCDLSYGKAYVAQDDLHMEVLTVEETLMFSAQLRLPQGWTQTEKRAVVTSVMAELGLTEVANMTVQGWRVRGISGGQRRRLTIGCELVTLPRLIFLDDPTSGLDAAAACFVVQHLQQICSKGRTLVAVLHQPSREVFALFKRLYLLAGGDVVFFGSVDSAAETFAAAGHPCPPFLNPADHFLRCLNKEFAEGAAVDKCTAELVDAYNKSYAKKAAITQVAKYSMRHGQIFVPPKMPRWACQVTVLIHRGLLENMRNIGIYQLRGAISICTCIFAGFCFFQLDKSWDSVPSRWGLLFFIPVFLAGISLTLVPSFQHNYKVFSQEKLSGYYGDSQFLVSTFVASLPFVVLIALSSACSVYFLAGLYLEGDRFPYFVLILILVQLVVESVVHAITSVCENSLLGILAGFGILGVFLLTCGFFTFQGLVPRIVFHYPLYYLSFYSFALSGLMTNELSGQEGFACICPVQVADCPHFDTCSISGKEILDFFQVPAREKYFDALVLLGNVVAYRVLFLVGMYLRDTKKRFRQQLNVMPRPRRVAPRVVSYKQEYVRAATIPLSAFNSA